MSGNSSVLKLRTETPALLPRLFKSPTLRTHCPPPYAADAKAEPVWRIVLLLSIRRLYRPSSDILFRKEMIEGALKPRLEGKWQSPLHRDRAEPAGREIDEISGAVAPQ